VADISGSVAVVGIPVVRRISISTWPGLDRSRAAGDLAPRRSQVGGYGIAGAVVTPRWRRTAAGWSRGRQGRR